MNELIIQDDFGGFNPRFPGVTIRFRSDEAYSVFRDFLASDVVPQDSPSFSVTAIRSILDHELRHYHDFLLSPYSAVIFRMRLQAATNGISVFRTLQSSAGSYVPAPLVGWVTLSAEQRGEHAREWGELLDASEIKSLGLVDLPYFEKDFWNRDLNHGITPKDKLDDAAFQRGTLEMACRAYLRIEQLTLGFAASEKFSELTPYNLYELLGIAAQGQAIWNGQGVAATQTFFNRIAELDLPYSRLWLIVLEFAKWINEKAGPTSRRAEVATPDQIVAISLWCLLGNYQAEGSTACPTIRFLKLTEHLMKAVSLQDVASDVALTWDHWDLVTGVKPWRESLGAMLSMNERGVLQYEELSVQGSIPPVLGRVMKRYVADQRRIVERLLASPNDLVHLNRYCNLPSGTLPSPLVRIDLDGIGFSVEDLKDTGLQPIWKVTEHSKEYVTRVAMRDRLPGFDERLSDAIEFEDLMQCCDLAISNHELPGHIHIPARRSIENFLGKKLLFLV